MAKHSSSGRDLGTDNTLVLDVGGKRFGISLDTLRRLPKSRLGRLALEHPGDAPGQPREFFFDRNPKMMNSILDFYRMGELHLPSNVCYKVVEEELKFWGVPLELMSDCCWKCFEKSRSERHVVSELHQFLQEPYPELVVEKPLSWRMRIWCLLERPAESVISRVWQVIFFSFVFLSILSFILETDRHFRVPTDHFRKFELEPKNLTLEEAYNELSPVHFMAVTTPDAWLHTLRYVTFAFFLADFFVRFTTCKAKKTFFKQYRNWLEIAVAVKAAIHFTMEKLVFSKEGDQVSDTEKRVSLLLYALSGMRVLRIFYLAKTFPSLKILILSLKSSLRDLLMMVLCAFSAVCVFGTLTYLVAVLHGLRIFPSIMDGLWYAIITMTTVGYGDMLPTTAAGKVVGSLCALAGVMLLALPIAVIANNFKLYHDNLRSCQQRLTLRSFLWAHPRYSICRPPVSPPLPSSESSSTEQLVQLH